MSCETRVGPMMNEKKKKNKKLAELWVFWVLISPTTNTEIVLFSAKNVFTNIK